MSQGRLIIHKNEIEDIKIIISLRQMAICIMIISCWLQVLKIL